jgi:hypothetical protein
LLKLVQRVLEIGDRCGFSRSGSGLGHGRQR